MKSPWLSKYEKGTYSAWLVHKQTGVRTSYFVRGEHLWKRDVQPWRPGASLVSKSEDFDLGPVDLSKSTKEILKSFAFEHQVVLEHVRKVIKMAKALSKEKRNEDLLDPLVVNEARRIYYLETDPCQDNFRVGDMDKSSQMRRYRKDRDSGCCGQHDEVFVMNGRRYLVGWNYGH